LAPEEKRHSIFIPSSDTDKLMDLSISKPSTVIVGAGISGLSLATALQKRGLATVVFEAAPEPGGNIKTLQSGTYRFDTGPNSLLVDDGVRQFLVHAGVDDLMIAPSDVSKNRYILWGGKPELLPASPPALLKSNFFSWRTKWRVLSEFFRRSKGAADETLAAFVRRRFSDEVVEKVLKPFVAGIYAGDPEQLLVKEAFPQLADYEHTYGSVLRGMMKAGSSGRKQSYSFKGGMQGLAKALAKNLDVTYNAQLTGVRKVGKRFRLLFNDAGSVEADRLVLALPAWQAAKILADLYPTAASAFRAVYYPPMCVVHTVFAKKSVGLLPDGFGLLHPKAEGTFTAGSIWSSSIFPDCCPDDQVLFTSFVGGTMFAENAALPQRHIVSRVVEELQLVYGIDAAPVATHFTRWEHAIPQYDKHIGEAKQTAIRLRAEGIYCHSNWVHGISLADCIRASVALASQF
jgi:oxygen-dependent protoporphyrinogen oxidase